MEIPKKLNDEIWDYCRANNIPNIDEFTLGLVKQGFTIEKFGATPTTQARIIEKIVEVPVEVIVEKIVDRIVEVPIEINNQELATKYNEMVSKYDLIERENEKLKKDLEIEKKKKTRDIYGE